MSVSLRLEQLLPTVTLKFLFKSNGLLNFSEFELYNLIIWVSSSVTVGEGFQSLLGLPLGAVPTWRLRNKPDEANLKKRRECLDQRWCSPCPVIGDLEGSKCQPRSNNTSEVPCAVVDGSVDGTMLGVNQLGDEKWGSTVGDGDAETKKESSTNEHAISGTDRLESTGNDTNGATNGDGGTTAEVISTVWGKWKSADRTSRHNSVQKTQLGGSGVTESCIC